MEPAHHDQVLERSTSHLPHLIAYTIVGTAFGLEESTRREVSKFLRCRGFRDFIAIAASESDQLWRDLIAQQSRKRCWRS
jgi:cyclohexadieny/prephenate dehydrogenase